MGGIVKRILFVSSVTFFLFTLADAADAQTLAAAPATDSGGLEEIVVTATRREEKLQDVPMAVSAVNGQTVAKYDLFSLDQIQQLTPGVILSPPAAFNGSNAAPTMRGVDSNAMEVSSATVDIYFNETTLDASYALQSIYDIGQIEVLRGPQGTVRGIPSPSGAITIATRRPDLGEIGGYVSASGGNQHVLNGQGAFNLPLIKDVLGLRVAALVDQNDYDNVRSLNNGTEPFHNTKSWRATLDFKPTSSTDLLVTYQDLQSHLRNFQQVYGTGALGPFPPANYNGPAIDSSERLSVESSPSLVSQRARVLTAQASAEFDTNRLVYIGGYQNLATKDLQNLDEGNFIPGNAVDELTSTYGYYQASHELRLESTGTDHPWDYVVGLYYRKTRNQTAVAEPADYLPGAFGAPDAVPSTAAFNPGYAYNLALSVPGLETIGSIFTNQTFHLPARTDLTLGVRYNIVKHEISTIGTLTNGQIAQGFGPNGAPLPAGSCAFVPPSAGGPYAETYPGFCDLALPNMQILNSPQRDHEKPWVYDAALSHKWTDDLNTYLRYAHSWRPGPANLGVNSVDPAIQQFALLEPETSNSIELGIKSQWLDRRLQVNTAVFYQKFQNFIYGTLNIPYVTTSGAVQTYNFLYNVPASVKGIDFDSTLQATEHWSVGLSASWADGHVNGTVPCQATAGGNFVPPGEALDFCHSNAGLSHNPPWSATAQSEFTLPVGTRWESYVRGFYTFYAANDHFDPGFTADSYGLMNVYAGVRSGEQGWDVGLYAKNAFNTSTELHHSLSQLAGPANSTAFFGGALSGYYESGRTLERQVGVSARYEFGSR
jgi:iron complex outermembrane receptor protein